MTISTRLGRPASALSESDALETLGTIARLSNALAKRLKGTPYQHLAYDIKALSLSSLVVYEVAVPDGIHPDNTIGFSFLGDKLHCPAYRMTATARAIALRKCASVQTTGPLADRLDAGELASLNNLRRDLAA